ETPSSDLEAAMGCYVLLRDFPQVDGYLDALVPGFVESDLERTGKCIQRVGVGKESLSGVSFRQQIDSHLVGPHPLPLIISECIAGRARNPQFSKPQTGKIYRANTPGCSDHYVFSSGSQGEKRLLK